jgi:hypothetical protein
MKTRIWTTAIALGLVAAASTAAPGAAQVIEQYDSHQLRGQPNSVVTGTIARTNARSTQLVLKDGTRLLVPLDVNVPRSMLTAPHSIKAYYVHTPEGNVVTQMEVLALQPGSGGSSAG